MSSKAAATNFPDYPKHPFRLSSEEVIHHLQVDTEAGLALAQAKELQSKYGQNKLAGEGGVKWYSVLMKQISNAMILVGAAAEFSLHFFDNR